MFVPKGPVNITLTFVQAMAWHQTGSKLLPEPMMTKFCDTILAALGHSGLKSNLLSHKIISY